MTGKSLRTERWDACFPGRSLSDTEAFLMLISSCGAEDLLLVAWEGHQARRCHKAFAEFSLVPGKAWQR